LGWKLEYSRKYMNIGHSKKIKHPPKTTTTDKIVKNSLLGMSNLTGLAHKGCHGRSENPPRTYRGQV
jgi:hypothetical protein